MITRELVKYPEQLVSHLRKLEERLAKAEQQIEILRRKQEG